MRHAAVHYKGDHAGTLTQQDDGSFVFAYAPHWLTDSTKPALSFGLPKRSEPFDSAYLFPAFYHVLPEGANRQWACQILRIDAQDDMSLLLQVATFDTVGALTFQPLNATAV